MDASFKLDGCHTLEVRCDVPRLAHDPASVSLQVVYHPLPFPTMGSSSSTEENMTPPLGSVPVIGNQYADYAGQSDDIVYYGPHACGVCGVMIVKAAREQGGAEYDAPSGPIYPNTRWRPHVHRRDAFSGETHKALFSVNLTPSAARAIGYAISSAATEARG
jgi:hypothetical protein